MKIINHLDHENDTYSLISKFLHLIGLGKLTSKVNFKRHSNCSLMMIISWLMSAHFARRSLQRAQPNERFSPRTARNVLNDGRINWQKLVCLVASQLTKVLAHYIDQRRRLALVVDDTLMARSCSKKTELLAKTFDHDKHRYVRGYRGLTIGWTDGNTFLPVNFALMSTKKKTNLLGSSAKITDQRKIAGQRRSQAQRSMNEVAVELIKQVLALGVHAKYVLFDSWYSSPKMFWQLIHLHLFGIGMLKRSCKAYYLYRGRQYSIKGLYNLLASSKMRRKNNYPYSSVVQAQYQGHQFPLKVVFVSKKVTVRTTQFQQQPALHCGRLRSFNYMDVVGKSRLILKLPNSIQLLIVHRFKAMTGNVATSLSP